MSRVAIPNLATDRKAYVGASILALAIGLVVLLAAGQPAMAGIVLSGSAVLISLVQHRQERVAQSQGRRSHSD